MLEQARKNLYENDPSKIDRVGNGTGEAASVRTLKPPSMARKEIEEIKAQMDAYKQYKEETQRLGKRNRVLSHGWRHGVVGQDDADSPKTSMFY